VNQPKIHEGHGHEDIVYGGPGRWTVIPPRNERHERATRATLIVIGLSGRLYVLLSTVLLPEGKKYVRTGGLSMRHETYLTRFGL